MLSINEPSGFPRVSAVFENGQKLDFADSASVREVTLDGPQLIQGVQYVFLDHPLVPFSLPIHPLFVWVSNISSHHRFWTANQQNTSVFCHYCPQRSPHKILVNPLVFLPISLCLFSLHFVLRSCFPGKHVKSDLLRCDVLTQSFLHLTRLT